MEMKPVQTILIAALVMIMLRVTTFSLPGPTGGLQTRPHLTTHTHSSTVHLPADKLAVDEPVEEEEEEEDEEEVEEPAKPLSPCTENCPCPTRDRFGAESCPCFASKCIWKAPAKKEEKKTSAELMADMEEVMNPRLGEPLPKAVPGANAGDTEEAEEEEEQDNDVEGDVGGDEGEDEVKPKKAPKAAAKPKTKGMKGKTIAERLKEGQFALAGRGVSGPYGDHSQDAGESFTILSAADVDGEGGARFVGANGKPTRMQFEPALVGALPSKDYGSNGGTTHKTCAIVGNSGTLLHSNFGAEIDSHEAVLRINFAPTSKWEKDVGSKTTYDFSNRENARRILKSKDKLRESTALFFEVSSPTNRKAMFVPLVKKHPNHKIHFLHPGFVFRGMDLWFDLKAEVEARRHTKFHDKPMSGFMAVLFMMNVCKQLDIYGFEAYTKKRADSPYHYFDNVQGVTQTHSFDFAIDAYRLLAESYPLTLK